MSKKIPYYYALPAIILGTLLALAVVLAWTEPSQAPPQGNVQTPLNIGTDTQNKSGGLGIGGVLWGNYAFFDGKVGIGTINPQDYLEIKIPSENSGGITIRNPEIPLAFLGDYASAYSYGTLQLYNGDSRALTVQLNAGPYADQASGWIDGSFAVGQNTVLSRGVEGRLMRVLTVNDLLHLEPRTTYPPVGIGGDMFILKVQKDRYWLMFCEKDNCQTNGNGWRHIE